jgi:hypothetical protein
MRRAALDHDCSVQRVVCGWCTTVIGVLLGE